MRLWQYIYTFRNLLIICFLKNIFSQNGKNSLKTSWPIFTQNGHQPKKINLADKKLRIYIYRNIVLYLWLQTGKFH
jgi:hypothetical protein